MNALVFDVESYAPPKEQQDEKILAGLTKYCKTDEERDQVLDKLGLFSVTAEIGCIAVFDPVRKRPAVFYRKDLSDPPEISLSQASWRGETLEVNAVGKESEAALLVDFWQALQHFDAIVTYNGRGFDCPFIMQRSLFLGVETSKTLNSNRYSVNRHLDLCDYLSSYGASKRYSLDAYCRALGITSPKEENIEGSQVSEYLLKKKMLMVADYCMRDVIATAELASKASHVFKDDLRDYHRVFQQT